MSAIGKQDCLIIPALSPYPDTAIQQISDLVSRHGLEQHHENLCFVGSSLGGYYSTWFAEKFNSRAVLINPSVTPYETLAEYIGENENYYTAQKYTFSQLHIQQLSDINVDNITQPERYWVLLQTGDEVLDYKQAETKYADCQLTIEQGGNHSFQYFENHIEKLLTFAGL